MFSLKLVITLKGLEPATSCVGDQESTKAPARHTWETWYTPIFMLRRFIRFAEFTEYLFHLWKILLILSLGLPENFGKIKCTRCKKELYLRWDITHMTSDWIIWKLGKLELWNLMSSWVFWCLFQSRAEKIILVKSRFGGIHTHPAQVHTGIHTPPVDRQTPVKTLPYRIRIFVNY